MCNQEQTAADMLLTRGGPRPPKITVSVEPAQKSEPSLLAAIAHTVPSSSQYGFNPDSYSGCNAVSMESMHLVGDGPYGQPSRGLFPSLSTAQNDDDDDDVDFAETSITEVASRSRSTREMSGVPSGSRGSGVNTERSTLRPPGGVFALQSKVSAEGAYRKRARIFVIKNDLR